MRSTSEHRRRSGTVLTGVVEQWIPPIAQTLSGAFPSFKFWHEADVRWPRDVGRPTAAFPTFVSERQSSGHGRRHVARRGAPRRAHASKLDLLGECEGVLDLDAEVLDGALDLGVTEQQLYCPEVARALVDLSRLGTAERMRAVAGWVKPDAGDPVLYQALILARRQVRAGPDAARE